MYTCLDMIKALSLLYDAPAEDGEARAALDARL
jgi:hypothetical protein